MSGWAEHVVRSFGLWGVATLMVLENLFPPIPSELILPLAATSGSLLGALFLYGLGASTLRTLNFLEPPQGEVRGTPLGPGPMGLVQAPGRPRTLPEILGKSGGIKS